MSIENLLLFLFNLTISIFLIQRLYSLQKRIKEKALPKEVRDELEGIIKTFNRSADKNILILEDRIKTVKELMHHLDLYKTSLEQTKLSKKVDSAKADLSIPEEESTETLIKRAVAVASQRNKASKAESTPHEPKIGQFKTSIDFDKLDRTPSEEDYLDSHGPHDASIHSFEKTPLLKKSDTESLVNQQSGKKVQKAYQKLRKNELTHQTDVKEGKFNRTPDEIDSSADSYRQDKLDNIVDQFNDKVDLSNFERSLLIDPLTETSSKKSPIKHQEKPLFKQKQPISSSIIKAGSAEQAAYRKIFPDVEEEEHRLSEKVLSESNLNRDTDSHRSSMKTLVVKYIKEGLSDIEISRRLAVSLGEIQLIRSFYKK